jgi:fatty acid desaturase
VSPRIDMLVPSRSIFMRHRPRNGRWIAHPADRLNAVRSLLAPFLLFAPFAFSFLDGFETIYAMAIFMLIGKTNYLLHLHIHRPFSRNSTLNILFDLSMGVVTGMTSSNWRIQHLYGHHRGIDLPYRGQRIFQMEKYSPLRALIYSTISLWSTFFEPIRESFRKGILANETTPINYRWAFYEQMLFLVFVTALFCWSQRLVVLYLLPWYLLTYFITRYVDYLNHCGCDESSENQYELANNSLSWWFNFSTHNFGYHTAHHVQPGAHWTELPEIHQAIARKIPEHCLKHFSWSGILLPYHFYRSWTGRM